MGPPDLAAQVHPRPLEQPGTAGKAASGVVVAADDDDSRAASVSRSRVWPHSSTASTGGSALS